MACLSAQPIEFGTPFADLMKQPKFRKAREVHARRARKLRRRGESVWFVRWEHGHCIYAWGGPRPEVFTFRMRRRVDTSAPEFQHFIYQTRVTWELAK
jgi:hypothetical protein